ncbi:MAG: formylglycine-generating enzyme family protein [Pseudomonadota bacterium]
MSDRLVELPFGPPDEALARELRQVAEAAHGVVRTLDALNFVPDAFPRGAVRDLCGALTGLPEGTAESSRTQLELARNLLPKIRREHFLEDVGPDAAAVEDDLPPLHRGGLLDQRTADLIAAVATALDEYRYQAQTHFDDTTRAEETIPTPDRSTVEGLMQRSDAVGDGVQDVIGELDAKRVSATARGDVLRRRLKDSQNLALAARAQLQAPPVVRRWLTSVAQALQRMPDLIDGAGRALQGGADAARPLAGWYETFKRNRVEGLLNLIHGLGRALIAIAKASRSRGRPGWAADGGRDAYGEWMDLEYGGVRQRLRLIPPGRFLMGSPPDEPGRLEAEGPQREVTIGEGFWMFATPVTQALYEAVMGKNPSRFASPTRPVERVTWRDVRTFLDRINGDVVGLDLVLPSEAQWEYASRSGTVEATYAGPIVIRGKNDAPILDDIAWYGGNSGVGFDLEEGYDSSRWEEKQHAHERAGSREVAQKRPNAWGLHDMLGNVLEWCADNWHESYEGAPADGSPWLGADADGGAHRVIRGGSWFNGARDCRAACRINNPPERAYVDLGFRPARGQV